MTIRPIRTAGSPSFDRASHHSRVGTIFAALLLIGLAAPVQAQSAAEARLQAETAALNAQMKFFDAKIPPVKPQPVPAATRGNKTPLAASQPSPFADKKIHIGGVTVTPGGFIDVEGLQR